MPYFVSKWFAIVTVVYRYHDSMIVLVNISFAALIEIFLSFEIFLAASKIKAVPIKAASVALFFPSIVTFDFLFNISNDIFIFYLQIIE